MKIVTTSLGLLQAFTALGAIPAGIGYLLDISGQKMGVSSEMLANSPLNSFLLPGMFLLIVNGMANAAASVLSFTKHRYSGYAGIVMGLILVIWIVVQVAWISLSSFLQPLFFMVGLLCTFLGWRIVKAGSG